MANHIMTTLRKFQHRHTQIFNAIPVGLQDATIMPIPRELLGISAAELPTHPVSGVQLSADVAHCALLSSQFGSQPCLQQRFYNDFNRCSGCTFGLLVDFFQDDLLFVVFQASLQKVYSYNSDLS
jgi:hypothetical protein